MLNAVRHHRQHHAAFNDALALLGAVDEALEIRERLVVIGEATQPLAGRSGCYSTAEVLCVVDPVDALLTQAITNCQLSLHREQRLLLRRVVQPGPLRGVDRVPVDGDVGLLIARRDRALLINSLDVGRCIRKERRSGADQPLVVEEGAAKGRLEEVVCQRVALGQLT